MRMYFGSAPTKTTSRFPLHQRQVAHFFCPIGISTRPPKTKKAFSVAILQRRLVCPDGIRQRRTPQRSVVFSIFRSIRMITSLSEERVSVFYQLPNGPARTNRQRIGHTNHHTQYTDAPISNVAGFYILRKFLEQSPQDTDADQIPSAAAAGVNTGTDHSRHTPERDAHSAVTTRTIAFQSPEWRLQDDA